MATTSYGVNHALTVKTWARKLFHEALKQTWVYKFIGTDANALIQTKQDLAKGPGDLITIGLRMLLTGDGIQGDGTLEGNEEALITFSDALVINQLRHAVRSAGKMSEQRVPFSVRQESMDGLADWWADRFDTWAANQLTGNTAATDTRFTGNNTVTAPDADHLIAAGGHDTEASLSATTTESLALSDIDRLVAKAKTLTPPIRPVRAGGGEYYCLFLHPFQVFQLRTSTTTNNWSTIQLAAMQGGEVTNSPIFTGALGMHNNVLLHEWTRIPVMTGTPNSGTAASFRRAVFCGAQAACLAYGQGQSPGKFTWVEELFDYGNQLGVSAGCIAGLKKNIFNSDDFATIAISSFAPAV